MTEYDGLVKTMQKRTLSLGEILKQAFALLTERFGAFFLLVLLVYLPIRFVNEYAVMKLALPLDSLENWEMLTAELTAKLAGLGGSQLVTSFLELVAMLVTAVMVHNLLFEPALLPFGAAFYRGVRSWLRSALTVMVIMLGLLMCLMSISIFVIMPGFALLMILLLLVLVAVYLLIKTGACTAAALRGFWGLHNIRYVSFVYQGYMGKAIGNTAAIVLLVGGINAGFNYLLSYMLRYIVDPWISLAVSVGFSTLLSMLTVYEFVALTLLFLSIEEKKRYEEEMAAL